MLGQPKQAWICEEPECEFISKNRNVIRQHCNGHGWKASKESPTRWHSVWVQCFFPSGGFQRYFTADYSEHGQVHEADPRQQDQEDVLRAWDVAIKKHEAEMDVIAAEVAKQDKTLW